MTWDCVMEDMINLGLQQDDAWPVVFNKKPFPVNLGKYSRNFSHAAVTLQSHMLHLHPAYQLRNLPVLVTARVQCLQTVITILLICCVYLSCRTQMMGLLHHSTALLMNPFLTNYVQISKYYQLCSYTLQGHIPNYSTLPTSGAMHSQWCKPEKNKKKKTYLVTTRHYFFLHIHLQTFNFHS